MTRPTFEVADILRVQGDRFLDRYRSSFGFQQLKAFRAILRCRTAALGGHRDACPSCVIRLSRTTRAETGTAPSVRRKHASAGWRPANANS
jgi:Transposase zinc-binding domain